MRDMRERERKPPCNKIASINLSIDSSSWLPHKLLLAALALHGRPIFLMVAV